MKKFLLGDFLFYFQMAGAVTIGVYQLIHMLTVSTVGLSTSTYLFTTLFVTINLFLAIASHRIQKSKITKQIVIIYLTGVIIYGSWVVTLFVKSETAWDKLDWYIVLLVSALVTLVALYAKIKHIPTLDPVVKGVYGLLFRAIPHLALAWKLLENGSDGLGVVTVILFHVLTLTRIFQIFRKYKTTWDRNKTGLAIAEIGNELSWVLVTIAWMV